MMKTYKLCPVCDTNLNRTTIFDGTILFEEYDECSNCSYSDEFEHGNYTVRVGDELFQWSYATSEDEVSRIAREIEETIECARDAQIEGLGLSHPDNGILE